MSLRRLGIDVHEQKETIQTDRDEQALLLKALNRLNDYMAFMTEESSPPTEHDDTDATT